MNNVYRGWLILILSIAITMVLLAIGVDRVDNKYHSGSVEVVSNETKVRRTLVNTYVAQVKTGFFSPWRDIHLISESSGISGGVYLLSPGIFSTSFETRGEAASLISEYLKGKR